MPKKLVERRGLGSRGEVARVAFALLEGRDRFEQIAVDRKGLWRADFDGANFANANLTNADPSFSLLYNLDLTSATLTGVIVYDAAWFNTICPDGTNSDDNDSTCEGHL
jgi:uncharacterized protein YjbI with pentapeptide repeats